MNKTVQERVQIPSSGSSAGSGPTGIVSGLKSWLAKNLHASKFVQHLIGIDQEPKFAKPTSPAQGSKRWTPSLHGVKFSDVFQGISLSTNFLFLLLFVGLFLWLFVIYWVRHHEPFANQVLGSPRASAADTAADRALVGGIKKAFPVRTSEHTGEIYVPGPQASTGTPVNTPVDTGYQGGDAGYQGAGTYSSSYGNPIPAQMAPAAAPAFPTSNGGSYMIGVRTGSGTKVKTIVSR